MRTLATCAAHAAILTASILGTVVPGVAAGFIETDLVVNRTGLTDSNGVAHPIKPNTGFVDSHLVNPWGLAASSTSPFWVSDNGAGVATLYDNHGVARSLIVSIPSPDPKLTPLNNKGTPTGAVFNIAMAGGAFPISGVGADGKPKIAAAQFLFATEDGTILGWNSGVFAVGDPNTTAPSTHAIIAVDNSSKGAVYKGLAIATDAGGVTRLYATNFRMGTVDVFESTKFGPITPAFTDPNLPRGYAPFNIVPIGSASPASAAKLVVTYAVQDEAKHDDVAGMSHGIVNTFDLGGSSLHRLVQHGQLDSPWGVALAPATFGALANQLLIGNFGNGHINAYNPTTGEFFDKMRNPHGQEIVIDGLWSLRFGSSIPPANPDANFGPNTVFFTAGPNGEQDGLFGAIDPSP